MLKLHSQVIGFYAPVPSRSRFSLHGALKKKTLQTLQMSCEPFISRSPLLFILRHCSQDQIYPSTERVSRLKRSQWEKKRERKESEQTVLAHESSVSLCGAHTINLLLTLLWKYVWRKQPIVVWNVFKYKIMPFVWGEKLEQCEGTKVPCGIY